MDWTNKTRSHNRINCRTEMTVADINTLPNTNLWGPYIGKPQFQAWVLTSMK